MHGLAPYFLGGLVAVTLTNWFVTIPGSDPAPGAFTARAQAASLTIPERSHKGDRLAPPAASERKVVVSAIEVVGARRTSIVYRDRDGHVLFRSDPLRHVTLAVKNAVLPQVTIRDDQNTRVAPQITRVAPQNIHVAPRNNRVAPVSDPDAASDPGPLAPGCDSAVSPLAAPLLARKPSRCLASLDGLAERAAL
jgi:hypothetical protein